MVDFFVKLLEGMKRGKEKVTKNRQLANDGIVLESPTLAHSS
jgi:hypothetical protein